MRARKNPWSLNILTIQDNQYTFSRATKLALDRKLRLSCGAGARVNNISYFTAEYQAQQQRDGELGVAEKYDVQ